MESKKTKRTMAKSDSDVAIAQKDIQIAVYAREIEAQAGEIRALRSELGKTKTASDSESAAHIAKMTECQNMVTSLESELTQLRGKLSEEHAAAHAAQERFLAEIESMRKGNAEMMARLAAAEKGKEVLSSEKAELAAAKAELTAENVRIAEECRAAREALERSLADAEFLRKGNAEMMARLTAVEKGKEVLASAKAELEVENARIAGECRAVREALDRSRSDAEFLREDTRSIMARLEAAESEKSELVLANDKLVADNNRLTDELGTARAYGKDREAKLSTEKAASAQFKQKADARYAEIASLKAKLKKAQDAETLAKRRAESADRQLSVANKALRECRAREDSRRPVKRFHRLVKAVLPYGLVCMWKRMAYGIAEDKPLLYYPGLMKRMRRIVKFMLPYCVVAIFKREKYGKRAV